MTPAALRALIDGETDNFIAASVPGGIEAQEAEGQRQLVAHANRLPIDGTINNPVEREKWEAAGFVFGEPIQEGKNRVFVACTFPEGWSMKPSDHSMWSFVIDDKGNERAKVFFKAAFYDYKAHTFGLDS